MTWSSSPVAVAAPTERAASKDWIGFFASVFILLTFSQFWVMPLTGPDGNAEASGLIRGLYFPAYAAALILAAARFRETVLGMLRAPLLWALIAMTFVSMVWSIDPGVTERRAVAVLFTTFAGVVVAARYDWPKLLEVIATTFAVLVLLCFAIAVLVPSYGRMTSLFPGAWRGVWYEKNALGNNMTLGYVVFCAAALLNPKRVWLWVGFAGLALVLVLLSTSKTSIVSLVVGMAALGFVILIKKGPSLAVLVTFASVTTLVAIGFAIYFDADLLFALLGKDATLTGRTKIWAAVLNQIHTRPWTGFGYGAVWTDTSIWGPLAWITKQAQFTAVHSHNSWLEVWLGLGYVGLAVWGLLFAEVWVRATLAAYRIAGGYFALPFLAVYSLMTLTESVALVYNDFIWVMFAAVAVKLAAPSRSAEFAFATSPLAAPLP